MAEVRSTFMLQPGQSAPEFSLPDAEGKTHNLSAVAGSAGLLVVFACNHCPFVVHLASELGRFAAEAKAGGVGTVAINSNDFEKYSDDAPEKMKPFVTKHGWDFPYLVDETQEVAKAYAAACTPDFYLFDSELRLFYAGQFDATRPSSGATPDGSDLRRALDRMLSSEEPLADAYPSSGCNIKWKPGNEPAWFG